MALFPQWQHEEGKVEFIRFTDGITNTLLKAVKKKPGYTEEQIDAEAVLLRAYGKGTEVLIDRERETVSHSLLAQYHFAPPLLARFQNGLIYSFIRGQVCSPADLRREVVRRGIARKLGEWHGALPIESTPSVDGVENSDEERQLHALATKASPRSRKVSSTAPDKVIPNLWTVMQKWIFALPTRTEAEKARKDELQQELERIVLEFGNFPGLGDHGLVFGHCDLLSGNVIIRPSQPADPADVAPVSFIDYEYATPVPAAFDIANHFAEWGGFDCDYNVLPTRSQRRAFIADYLDSYCSFMNDEPHPTSELPSLQQQLFDAVDHFRGIPGFYWGIWALIQATISQIDFDYASYAEVRLGEYWAWRAEEDGSRESSGKEMPLRERRWAEE